MKLDPSSSLNKLMASNQRFLELFTHGSLSVEIYKPAGHDLQQPHDRDEIYVIIDGHGIFQNGSQQVVFGASDVLFVPAGVDHRFVEFSEDFVTWVFFYGPVGGESGSAPENAID